MSVATSGVVSSVGTTYVPAARDGINTVAKEAHNAEAERSTGIESAESRFVESVEQKAQIDQLEKRIDSKEKENDQQNARSEEELSQLEQQLSALIDRFSKNPTNIRFSHSETTSGQVIDVIDTETDETIRQIPSEEALAIRERLNELSEMYSKAKNSNADFGEKAKSILMDTKV